MGGSVTPDLCLCAFLLFCMAPGPGTGLICVSSHHSRPLFLKHLEAVDSIVSATSAGGLERGSLNDEGRCVQAGGVCMSGLCLRLPAPLQLHSCLPSS